DDGQGLTQRAERLLHVFQFGGGAPGDGPTRWRRLAGGVFGQVPGQDLPDKTGCAKHDEVVGLSAHELVPVWMKMVRAVTQPCGRRGGGLRFSILRGYVTAPGSGPKADCVRSSG